MTIFGLIHPLYSTVHPWRELAGEVEERTTTQSDSQRKEKSFATIAARNYILCAGAPLHCDGLCTSLLLLPLLIPSHICCLGPTDLCLVLSVWTPFEGRPACCVAVERGAGSSRAAPVETVRLDIGNYFVMRFLFIGVLFRVVVEGERNEGKVGRRLHFFE